MQHRTRTTCCGYLFRNKITAWWVCTCTCSNENNDNWILLLIKNTTDWINEWMNEWMNEESWMRGLQTCPLTIHFNMWKVNFDVSIQRCHWQPLSVHLWAYCSHPNHDVNDVMSEGWPQHRGLRPLLFSNSGEGSFTSHKSQISVSAVRRDLQFLSLSEKTRKSNCLLMSL